MAPLRTSTVPSQSVEGESWTQLVYPAASITASKHVDDEVELSSIQMSIGKTQADLVVQIIHFPIFGSYHGNDDLAQDIEGALNRPNRLDIMSVESFGENSRFEEVVRIGRKQCGTTHDTDLVARTPHALNGRGDRWRRLGQYHLIQGANVYAHLQGVGGDNRLQFTRLQSRFHDFTDLTGEGAVVSIGQRSFVPIIEHQGEFLAQPAGVGKYQGRAIVVDDFLEDLHQGGPDGIIVLGLVDRSLRKTHADIILLRRRRLDDLHLTRSATLTISVQSADEFGHPIEGANRR